MAELEITGTMPLLTEDAIAAVERQIGVSLPIAYRSFLLRYNGGRPEPNMFPIQGFYADTHGLLEWFFCIAEDDIYDLTENELVYRNRVPSDLLPIATDPGGNLLCLAVKGDRYGRIYFWHHEDEGEEGAPPTYNNVYSVADSFENLLNSLQNHL
ncbi:MAG: SMI1/KNR4 family protein [Caldilinea sp. CFX5]|nr:SMI1/KNR4 family protein [Caldilinea sp. CFX5]